MVFSSQRLQVANELAEKNQKKKCKVEAQQSLSILSGGESRLLRRSSEGSPRSELAEIRG